MEEQETKNEKKKWGLFKKKENEEQESKEKENVKDENKKASETANDFGKKAGEAAKEFGKKAGKAAKEGGKWLGDKLMKGIAKGGAEIRKLPIRTKIQNCKSKREKVIHNIGLYIYGIFARDDNAELVPNDYNKIHEYINQIKDYENMINKYNEDLKNIENYDSLSEDDIDEEYSDDIKQITDNSNES